MTRTITLGALLLLGCAGCAGPVDRTFGPASAREVPHLVSVGARVDGATLVVEIHTDRPLLDLRGQDLQVFVDADDDAATGYGAHGDEFVARVVESPDATRFPVRRTQPADPADPAGWGAITGTGWIGTGRQGPMFRIPLAALGHDDGRLRLRVEMYSGGTFDFRDASTDPMVAAAH